MTAAWNKPAVKGGEEVINLNSQFRQEVTDVVDGGLSSKTLIGTMGDTTEKVVEGGEDVVESALKGGTYSGDLMSAEEAALYSEHWRELGIGSDNTWKAFKDANPKGTIDEYFEIVQKQSPWPLGKTGTPTTLKAGDRFFDFSDLSFTEQNQTQRLGIGMVPKDNNDRGVCCLYGIDR